MNTDTLKRLLFFIVLAVTQALVFNHIHILGVATPLVLLLLPVSFDSNQKRWSALIWSFLLGITVDIFANTPGMAAFSLTMIGFLQPLVLRLFVEIEDGETVQPSLYSIGWSKYVPYLLTLTLAYCIIFFTIEFFTLYSPLVWIECVTASTILTLAILLALDKIRGRKK